MVTEFIENAWKAYRNNFWQIIGAIIILGVIVFGIIFISLLPLLGFISSGITTEISSQAISVFILQNLSSLILYGLVSLIGIIVAFIISIELSAGLIGVYRDALKGKADLKTMFSVAKEKFWTILGANLLAGLLVTGIFVLTLLPGILLVNISSLSIVLFILGLITAILLSLLFSLVNQAIVVDNEKAVNSIKKSYFVVRKNYLELLGLIIILVVISFVLSLIPLIGKVINWLLVTPVFGLAITSFYITKTKKVKKKAKRIKKKR